jgi:hypothetical protein
MNLRSGLKVFSAAALLTLAGCMTRQDSDAENAANAQRLKFVNATAASLAKLTIGNGAGGEATVKVDYNAIGCPKLAKVMEDLQGNTGNTLPASFRDFLSCFGISGSGSLEDVDGITEKIKNDLPAILDCVCGGSALSDLLSGKIELFSASASSAAASSFSASSSGAGESFDASSSSAGGSTYSGGSSHGYSSP